MPTEIYDDLIWTISTIPSESCTPDEFYELGYRATSECENGHRIEGMARYWSRDDGLTGWWLDRIDYEPCEECAILEEEELPDEEDEEL